MSLVTANLHGVILNVADLDRAISFYTHLLDLTLVRHDAEAAVLADASGSEAIALRQRRVEHFTDRTVQALIWSVPTAAALDNIEQRLHHLDAALTRHDMPEESATLLSAWDTEGQRLLFTHHEGDREISSDRIASEIFWY